MKKYALYTLFVVLTCHAKAQTETYINYNFKGNSFNAIIVKVDPAALERFEILENPGMAFHNDFIKGLTGDSLIFITNACIFDAACKPLGYYVNNYKQIQPINLSDGNGNFFLKPNGALLFTDKDAIVCESSDVKNFSNVRIGIQSGPMLLNNGNINNQFNSNSPNKFIRSGVGIFTNQDNTKSIIFGISNNPVNFYDFATFFKEKFNCSNALCLESAGSVMYFPGQSFTIPLNNKLICSYIYYKF